MVVIARWILTQPRENASVSARIACAVAALLLGAPAPAESQVQPRLQIAKVALAGAVVVEGEQLAAAAKPSEGRVSAQPMGAFGKQWRGGAQLFWMPTRVGSRLELPVDVPAAGRYELAGHFTRAPDYGRFDVGAEGQRIGAFDGFGAAGVTHSGRVVLGQVQLSAGRHLLVFVITGKDGRARGHYVGIDALELTPAAAAPAPSGPSIVGRPAAGAVTVPGAQPTITPVLLPGLVEKPVDISRMTGVVQPSREGTGTAPRLVLGLLGQRPELKVWNGQGGEFSFYQDAVFVDWNQTDLDWSFRWSNPSGKGTRAVWQVSRFRPPDTTTNWSEPPGLIAQGEAGKPPAPGHVAWFDIDLGAFAPRPPGAARASASSARQGGVVRAGNTATPAGKGADKDSVLVVPKILPGLGSGAGSKPSGPVSAGTAGGMDVKLQPIDQRLLAGMATRLSGNPWTYCVRLLVLDAAGAPVGPPSNVAVVTYGQPDPPEFEFTPEGLDPPPPPPDPHAPTVTLLEYQPIRPQADDAHKWYLCTRDFGFLKAGVEYKFEPAEDDIWDKIEGAISDGISFFQDAVNWVATAYEDIKSAAVDVVASAIPGCNPACRFALTTGLDIGCTALGLPPEIPNWDQLVDMGKGNLAEVLVAQAGLQDIPLSEELAKEILDRVVAEATRSANHGPGGNQFLRPAPSKQFRPAFMRVRVTNPPGAGVRDAGVNVHAWYVYITKFVPVPNLQPGESREITIYLKPDLVYWEREYLFEHKGAASSHSTMTKGWTDLYYQGEADMMVDATTWPKGTVDLLAGKTFMPGSRGAYSIMQRPSQPYVHP